ncbi:MAG: DUF4342 domain-containing protein [Bacilli bacterium]|nr:DUF4342 domain-containing protein [Bacilli bacterium]
MKEDNKQKAEQIVNKIKELVKKGNITKIIINKNGKTIVNLPLNAGIIGIALAPWAMLVATIVTLGTECEIKLEKEDKTIIDISDEDIKESDREEKKNV